MSSKNFLTEPREEMRIGFSFIRPCCFLYLCFKPNYQEAHDHFQAAAQLFKKYGYKEQQIEALEEKAKCSHELRIYEQEIFDYKQIADIRLSFLQSNLEDYKVIYDNRKLINDLLCTSNAYKLTNHYAECITLFLSFAEALVELKYFEFAYELINTCYEANKGYSEEKVLMIEMNKLMAMLIDLCCYLDRIPTAIETLTEFIKIQRKSRVLYDDSNAKSKISRNYIYLGMLRIINDEIFLIEDITQHMFEIYDNTCKGDINDLKQLTKAFKEKSYKDFSFCMKYSFILFPNNLLKKLKKKYESESKDL